MWVWVREWLASGLPDGLVEFQRRSAYPPVVLARLAAACCLRPYASSRTAAQRQVDLLRYRAGAELPLL